MAAKAPRWEDLPPGPVRTLFEELHALWSSRGRPSSREIASRTNGALSHTSVQSALTGARLPSVPKQSTLTFIIRALRGDIDKFIELRNEADDARRAAQRPGKPGPIAGVDIEEDLEVPLWLAVSGGVLPAIIRGSRACELCPDGPTNAAPCPECDGTGEIEVVRTETVPLPAGTQTGKKILLPGMGTPGRFGGRAGDLWFTIVVKAVSAGPAALPPASSDAPPHGWEVEFRSYPGSDLRLQLDLVPELAAEGVELPLELYRWMTCDECRGTGITSAADTCEGCVGDGRFYDRTTLTARLPPGVTDGNLLRCRGRGNAGMRGGTSGDLYLVVTIKESISEEAERASTSFTSGISDSNYASHDDAAEGDVIYDAHVDESADMPKHAEGTAGAARFAKYVKGAGLTALVVVGAVAGAAGYALGANSGNTRPYMPSPPGYRPQPTPPSRQTGYPPYPHYGYNGEHL